MAQDIDSIQSLPTVADAKGIIAALFGPAASEIGVAIQGYFIPWTLSNIQRTAEKVRKLREEHGIDATKSLPPRYAFAILDGAAKEDDEKLSDMWAALISKSTDPSSGYSPLKRHIELLKVLDPLQVKILGALDNRKDGVQPPFAYFGANELSGDVDASLEDTLMALRALFVLGLVSDHWLQTYDGAGADAEMFANTREHSHILLTAFGRDLVNACRYSK